MYPLSRTTSMSIVLYGILADGIMLDNERITIYFPLRHKTAEVKTHINIKIKWFFVCIFPSPPLFYFISSFSFKIVKCFSLNSKRNRELESLS